MKINIIDTEHHFDFGNPNKYGYEIHNQEEDDEVKFRIVTGFFLHINGFMFRAKIALTVLEKASLEYNELNKKSQFFNSEIKHHLKLDNQDENIKKFKEELSLIDKKIIEFTKAFNLNPFHELVCGSVKIELEQFSFKNGWEVVVLKAINKLDFEIEIEKQEKYNLEKSVYENKGHILKELNPSMEKALLVFIKKYIPEEYSMNTSISSNSSFTL